MRVVGGEFRGRILQTHGFSGRPTMDRVREALLNIVTNRIDLSTAHVLDLFAGTGAVGIEFASWGASHVTLVESSAKHARIIKGNIALLGLQNATVACQDALRFARASQGRYGVIFADPPYHMESLPDLPMRLLGCNLLEPGGLLIVEHPVGTQLNGTEGWDIRHYGETAFSIFSQPGA